MKFLMIALLLAAPTKKRAKQSQGTDAQVKAGTRAPKVVEDARRAAGPRGPQLGFHDVRLEVAAEVGEVRKRQITMIEELLDLEVDPNRRGDLLFRKAELKHERARFFSFVRGAAEEKLGEAQAKGEEAIVAAEKAAEKAKLDERRASRQAIAVYDQILKEIPTYERTPDVLHALGQAWWELGFKEAALDVYTRIIREYPDSGFVPDAWVSFGEYYFGDQQLDMARKAYQKAAAYPKPEVQGFAEYKLGWVFYNLGDFPESCLHFQRVMKLAADVQAQGHRKFTLDKEARKDWITAYSHFGNADTAFERIRRIAPEHVRPMGARLADRWIDAGRDKDAISLLDDLITNGSEDPLLPSYYAKQLRAVQRLFSKDQVVERVGQIIDKLVGTEVPRAEAALAAWRQSLDEVDLGIRRIATRWHQDAVKLKNDQLMGQAEQLYAFYMNLFGDREEAYEIRFYHAEALYALGRFAEAGVQYQATVQANETGPYSADAALEMVRSYDKLSGIAEANKEDPDSEQAKTRNAKMIEACGLYLKLSPEGDMAATARFRIGRAHYDREELDPALGSFEALLNQETVDPSLAEASANLILDIYNFKKDWRKIIERAQSFVEDPRFSDNDDFVAKTQELADGAGFKVRSLDLAGKPHEAIAEGYLDYVKENPRSRWADRALFNAAVHYEKGGRNDKAMESRRQLVADYPKSSLTGRVDYLLANAGVKTADYENAARRLERFAKTNATDERALAAWLDASVYREGLGQYKTALYNRRRWIKLAPRAKKKVEAKRLRAVQLSLGQLIDKVQKPGKAAGYYDRLADKFKDPEAVLQARGEAARAWRVIRSRAAWAKNGKARAERRLQEAMRHYREKGLDVSGEAANVVAEAELSRLAPDYEAFLAQRLPSPDRPERFQEARTQLENRLAELTEAYGKVVAVGSRQFTVDALERMGGLRQGYIVILMKVPAPRGLTEVQQELWQDKLTEWAMPIENQALQYYEQCASLARKAALENPAVSRCMDVLKTKKPQDYPRLVEDFPPRRGLRLARHSPLGDLALAAVDMKFLADLVKSSSPPTPSLPSPDDLAPVEKAEAASAETEEVDAEEEARRSMQDDGTVETDEGAASSGFFEEEE